MQVIGAYGRNYDDFASAKKDWQAGKDFKIVGGSYMSNRDWNPLDSIMIMVNDKLEYLEVGLV